MPGRSEFGVRVESSISDGDFGWTSEFFDVPNAVRRYTETTGLNLTRETGAGLVGSRMGRGTTLFDLVRRKVDGPFAEVQFLAVKSGGEKGRKLPQRVTIATGNRSTIDQIIRFAQEGGKIPMVFFWAPEKSSPGWDGWGRVAVFDVGQIIRKNVSEGDSPKMMQLGKRWGRGMAPAVYLRWSAGRKSGTRSKGEIVRGDQTFPHYDDQGRAWSAATKVHYPELTLRRPDVTWAPIHVDDLAEHVETALDWNPGF